MTDNKVEIDPQEILLAIAAMLGVEDYLNSFVAPFGQAGKHVIVRHTLADARQSLERKLKMAEEVDNDR